MKKMERSLKNIWNRREKEREGKGKKRRIGYEYSSNCQVFVLLKNCQKYIY